MTRCGLACVNFVWSLVTGRIWSLRLLEKKAKLVEAKQLTNNAETRKQVEYWLLIGIEFVDIVL